MKLLTIVLASALALFTTAADAKHRGHVRHHVAAYTQADPGCNIIFPCEGVVRNKRGDDFADKARFGSGIPRYYHHSAVTPHRAMHTARAHREGPRVVRDVQVATVEQVHGGERPSDCYGIQWCGCWLRHHLGLAGNKVLNLARAWVSVGSPTHPHVDAVVVWNHHVGILKSEPVRGYALVLSGNNGSGNRATIRRAYVGNAIAYRQL